GDRRPGGRGGIPARLGRGPQRGRDRRPRRGPGPGGRVGLGRALHRAEPRIRTGRAAARRRRLAALRRLRPVRRQPGARAAAAAAQARGAPEVTVDERWTEIDAGPFEGLTVAEIEAGPLAGAHARWHADSDPVAPAGAEALAAARDRAAAFFASVRELPGTTLA